MFCPEPSGLPEHEIAERMRDPGFPVPFQTVRDVGMMSDHEIGSGFRRFPHERAHPFRGPVGIFLTSVITQDTEIRGILPDPEPGKELSGVRGRHDPSHPRGDPLMKSVHAKRAMVMPFLRDHGRPVDVLARTGADPAWAIPSESSHRRVSRGRPDAIIEGMIVRSGDDADPAPLAGSTQRPVGP